MCPGRLAAYWQPQAASNDGLGHHHSHVGVMLDVLPINEGDKLVIAQALRAHGLSDLSATGSGWADAWIGTKSEVATNRMARS